MLGKIIEAVIRNHQQTNILQVLVQATMGAFQLDQRQVLQVTLVFPVNLHSTAAKNILITLLVIWQQTFFR